MNEPTEKIPVTFTLNRKNIIRLQNLALHYHTSSESIIDTLLDKHIKSINISVMEMNKFNAFTRSFHRYVQDELKILGDSTYTDEDEKLYKVFESLIDHTFDNKMLLSELYEVYKK